METTDLQVRDPRFKGIADKVEEMRKRQFEFAQSRSTFQIEKFVTMEEYTPVSKYRHLAYNSYVMMNSVKSHILQRERMLRQIERKQEDIIKEKDPHYKDYDLDIYDLNCQLEEIEVQIKGTLQEIDIFEKICDKLQKENGKPFTHEDFEKDQPNYWKIKIANQIHNNHASRLLGINEGNFTAYLKALEQPILNSENTIDQMPISSPNDMGCIALESRERIKQLLIKTDVPKEQPQNL